MGRFPVSPVLFRRAGERPPRVRAAGGLCRGLLRSCWLVKHMEELCADTIRHAEELGIYVQISGNFPQHPSYRLLTDRAIRECVTNCARHAHGSTVLVKIEKGANEYSIRITNDGDAPEKNAEEGGGLSALRKAAESEKCIMQVSFSPEFCLVLKMPLTERMGVYGTDTDSRRSEDHAEVF